MAEQLILKGTLEGHVSSPLPSVVRSACRRELESGNAELCAMSIREILTVMPRTEWLGHQLGHLHGEVR